MVLDDDFSQNLGRCEHENHCIQRFFRHFIGDVHTGRVLIKHQWLGVERFYDQLHFRLKLVRRQQHQQNGSDDHPEKGHQENMLFDEENRENVPRGLLIRIAFSDFGHESLRIC